MDDEVNENREWRIEKGSTAWQNRHMMGKQLENHEGHSTEGYRENGERENNFLCSLCYLLLKETNELRQIWKSEWQ
jgi:hypothetical protein